MKKTALLLMIITVFSKIFGFAREISLSYFYGATSISDIYIVSLTIPLAIFGFIGTGVATGYIPMYSKIENELGEEEGNRFTNNLVNILLLVCTFILIIGLVFTKPIVKAFALGFTGETLELAVKFTRITMFQVYFMGLVIIFSGFLQIKKSYFVPALTGFPMNFVIIISMIISKRTNVMVLVVGSVIAYVAQLIFLIPFIRKKGYRYKFIFDLKDKYIKDMANIVGSVIIGVSVNQINTLVDRTMSSQISDGAMSALNYAGRLNGFVHGLFVVSIATVMYPMISKMAVKDNMSGLKKSLLDAVSAISLVVIPTTIGAMIFAKPIVELLFNRGAFDSKAVAMTAEALFFYSFGMVAFGLRDILSRVFYSLQDVKTPMINAAIALSINIILNIILSKLLGIGGLALATSISGIFCTTLLFISLRKKIGPFGVKSIAASSIKILCASLIMGLAAKLSFVFLLKNISTNLALVFSIALGALIYFVLVYIMRVKDVELLVNAIKRRLK